MKTHISNSFDFAAHFSRSTKISVKIAVSRSMHIQIRWTAGSGMKQASATWLDPRLIEASGTARK
jgi:two-component sensor histidine kinase